MAYSSLLIMKLVVKDRFRLAGALAGALAILALVAGCDDDYDHKPPAGMGSILLDNRTHRDIRVFINSVQQEKARDYEVTAYDLQPATYRLVLQEDDGYRSHSRDIDILPDKRTIVEVRTEPSSSYRYQVNVWYD